MAETTTTPFVMEKTYKAPVEKVWQAITDKQQMKQWYFDIKEFKPEVGFEFEFSGTGSNGVQYLHKCRVTEVEPGKKLTYSWSYDGFPGMSFVTFELFSEGDTTTVKLTHRGLESFAGNGTDFARESFKVGWTELIGKLLKEFVEK